MIIVTTYERYHSDIRLVELTKYESRLLAFAAYLFETYYLVNRNKKIKASKQKINDSIETYINKDIEQEPFE
ncbi:MAG TPA: hypothetical protein LFW21_07130 [Rickettsia endosymbiont of Pyrocoelia pectoralis]|nr:hypothetical protein [Rickettsia endosymbiont of Pyrocoelia pectoralis]